MRLLYIKNSGRCYQVPEDLTIVDSLGECEIANFLFRNQVEYEHAEPATWAEPSREHKIMEPDFRLTKYDIFIEHWALDENDQVPSWFRPDIEKGLDPTERYKGEMDEKKMEYEIKNKTLIETRFAQYQNKTLIPFLKEKLLEKGVKLEPLTKEQIQEKIKEASDENEPLVESIMKFINIGKSNRLTTSSVEQSLILSKWNLAQTSFAKIVIPVWEKYQALLHEQGKIDFNDMINEAYDIAKRRKEDVVQMYSHILVDEYQDITDNQVQLIGCFLDPNYEKTSLFCVGDDWQNIFTWAGANVKNIVEFHKDFPLPETTFLGTNYRCPKKIIDASNNSIRNNRFQIPKEVRGKLNIDCQIFACERPDKNFGSTYDDWEELMARQTLEYIRKKKKNNESVLVLSRYNYRNGNLKRHFHNLERDGIKFRSIHGAKGTEADYIMLLGCVEGTLGFPSEFRDSSLFDLVRSSRREKEILEEERRLFYVALTRCKKEAYIFTSKKSGSRFVKEIKAYLTPFDITATVNGSHP